MKLQNTITTRFLSAVLVDTARANPHLTLVEVIRLAKAFGVGLKSVRVGDFMNGSAAARPNGAREPLGHQIPKWKIVAAYSTRTPAERRALDDAIQKQIAAADGWVRAEAMRQKHFRSVSPLQFRKACNRLIKSRRIKTQGQARGKEYRA